MSPLVRDLLTADTRDTILRNVRLEVDAVQRETHQRLHGRYSPTADAKAALRGVDRLAAAVEALAMLIQYESAPDVDA